MEDASAIFPHPLSQVLVTALHRIPANYPHELRRTKTAQCGGSEAQPRLSARDGETRHFASAPAPTHALHTPQPHHLHHLQVRRTRPLSGERPVENERGGEGRRWGGRGGQKWKCKDGWGGEGRERRWVRQQEEPASLGDVTGDKRD